MPVCGKLLLLDPPLERGSARAVICRMPFVALVVMPFVVGFDKIRIRALPSGLPTERAKSARLKPLGGDGQAPGG